MTVERFLLTPSDILLSHWQLSATLHQMSAVQDYDVIIKSDIAWEVRLVAPGSRYKKEQQNTTKNENKTLVGVDQSADFISWFSSIPLYN